MKVAGVNRAVVPSVVQEAIVDTVRLLQRIVNAGVRLRLLLSAKRPSSAATGHLLE